MTTLNTILSFVHGYNAQVRFASIGWFLMMPLLGALTATPSPELSLVLGLLFLGWSGHHYIMLMNDIVDLPVDKGSPFRQKSPLVQGKVTTTQLWWVVAAQIPLSLAVCFSLEFGWASYAFLGVFWLAGAIHSFYSKYNSFPFFTDVCISLCYTSTVLLGATATGQPLSTFTLLVFASMFLWGLLFNGVFSSLKELPNDIRTAGPTCSLPAWLGAKLHSDGSFDLPGSLYVYAYTLQLVGSGIFLYVSTHWFQYVMFSLHLLFSLVQIWRVMSLRSEEALAASNNMAGLFLFLSLLANAIVVADRVEASYVLLLCLLILVPVGLGAILYHVQGFTLSYVQPSTLQEKCS